MRQVFKNIPQIVLIAFWFVFFISLAVVIFIVMPNGTIKDHLENRVTINVFFRLEKGPDFYMACDILAVGDCMAAGARKHLGFKSLNGYIDCKDEVIRHLQTRFYKPDQAVLLMYGIHHVIRDISEEEKAKDIEKDLDDIEKVIRATMPRNVKVYRVYPQQVMEIIQSKESYKADKFHLSREGYEILWGILTEKHPELSRFRKEITET